jgi:hypothetical protein
VIPADHENCGREIDFDGEETRDHLNAEIPSIHEIAQE